MKNKDTWRAHSLTVGARYLALVSLYDGTALSIVKGETYQLAQVHYSHYDGVTVFEFRVLGGRQPIRWCWRDDDKDDLCERYFVAV